MPILRNAAAYSVVIIVLSLGLLLIWHAAVGLRSGAALATGRRKFPRRKQPAMYWFTIAVQAGLAAVMIYAASQCLMHLIGP